MDLVSNKRYYDETQKYGIINDNERIKLIIKSSNYHHTDCRKIMTLMFQALAFHKST